MIDYFYGTIRIPVLVWRNGKERVEEEKSERRQLVQLMHLYMDYRTGRIHRHEWLKECHVIVNRMVSRDTNHIVSRLYLVLKLVEIIILTIVYTAILGAIILTAQVMILSLLG